MLKKFLNILKKIWFIKLFANSIKCFDFNKDKNFYAKNYMYSTPITKEKLEYNMLLEIHKLEKGFAVPEKQQRPFGFEKISQIMKNVEEYEKNEFDMASFAYNLSYSSLTEYLRFYEQKNWIDREEYRVVREFMNNKSDFTYIPVGAIDCKKEELLSGTKFDYDQFISSRRSVRNFSSKALSKEDITKAIEMAIKTPTACNRQMCKIYYVKSQAGKEVIEKYAQGLGLFDLAGANYFVITFDVSANYFVGERNQGWFNSGLVTMNFVNALHSLGIGSCCIQFGNTFSEEKQFKEKLNISFSERVGVIITAGYYDTVSRIPYSSRKPLGEVYRER